MTIADWIGKTESHADVVTAAPLAALSATLDRDDPLPQPGDPVPLLWHWLYFLPLHRQSALGADGHARIGDFLPPVSLPRRMYGGGRIDVHQPLRVGDAISRVSRIADVSEKQGRSGSLVFVKVRHEISNRAGLALVEDHDIVYREADAGRASSAPDRSSDSRPAGFESSGPQEPRGAGVGSGQRGLEPGALQESPAWTREIVPDEVFLFRYSALTFNGYRLHYDRRFATEAQGYPGLVVHAPLIATLLADLLRRNLPEANVSAFSFRAIRPLFDGTPILAGGRPAADGKTVTLWAQDVNGATAFEATVVLSDS